MFTTDPINPLQFHSPLPWLVLSFMVWLALVVLATSLPPRPLLWLHAGRWVVIPYLGILTGGISPSLMGLTNIDWYVSLGVGIALFLGMIVVLGAIRLALDWAFAGQQIGPSGDTSTWAELPANDWHTNLLRPLINGAEQFHWAFLRAGIWEIFLTLYASPTLPAYWAICLATLIAVPEILMQRLGFLPTLTKFVILIMTAVLFFYTLNFWLCWLLHALSAQVLRSAMQRRSHTPAR